MVSSRSRRSASATSQKKSRRFRRLLKLITGRRQTEWTGATRCPKEDGASHNRESLIDRKRTVSFRLCLPCRPLAELPCAPDAAQCAALAARCAADPRPMGFGERVGPGSAEQRHSASQTRVNALIALHRVRDTKLPTT